MELSKTFGLVVVVVAVSGLVTHCSSLSVGEAKSLASVKSPSLTQKLRAVVVQVPVDAFKALPDDEQARSLFIDELGGELTDRGVQAHFAGRTPASADSSAGEVGAPELSLIPGKVSYLPNGEAESVEYEVRLTEFGTAKILYRAIVHHTLGDTAAGPQSQAHVLASGVVAVLAKDGVVE